jgi:hypothetical protein
VEQAIVDSKNRLSMERSICRWKEAFVDGKKRLLMEKAIVDAKRDCRKRQSAAPAIAYPSATIPSFSTTLSYLSFRA